MTDVHFLFGASRPGRERRILVLLFVSIYVTYAALGHDVVLNKANCPVCFSHDALSDISAYDPIGHFLPFARVIVCAGAILLVWATCGAQAVAERAPLLFAPFAILA